MAVILHLVRTDLRQFRILLLVLISLLIADVALSFAAVDGAAMAYLNSSFSIFEAIAAGFLIVFAVQSDSTVDTRAHWMSRPISRRMLLAAKFMLLVIAVWLPVLVLKVAKWWVDGFTAPQLMQGAVELLFYLMIYSSIVGSITSFTARFWSCLLAAIGFWIVMIFSFEVDSFLRIDLGGLLGFEHFLASEMGETLIWSLLIAIGTVAVVMQYLTRHRLFVAVGLAAGHFAVILISPDRLPSEPRPELPLPADLTMASADVETMAAGDGRSDLFGNLRVDGLAGHEFVMPLHLRAEFHSDVKGVVHLNGHWGRSSHSEGHVYRVLSVVRSQLPEGVALVGVEEFRAAWEHVGVNVSSTVQQMSSSETGVFQGTVDFLRCRPEFVGRMPLRKGASVGRDGYAYRVTAMRKLDANLTATISLTRPTLLFGSRGDTKKPDRFRRPNPSIYVVCDEQAGVATVLSGYANVTAELPPIAGHEVTRLATDLSTAGIQAGDGDLVLYVFRVIADPPYRHQFEIRDHTISLRYLDGSRPVVRMARPVARESVELSSSPNADEISTFVDQILARRGDIGWKQQRAWIEKTLGAASVDLVPALAERLPVRRVLRSIVYRFLIEHAEERHVPVLVDALGRDPGLAVVFREKGWHAQSRAVVIEQLARRRPDHPVESLLLAAAISDPASFEDLSWHLIHGVRNRGRFWSALETADGFDAESALLRAWPRARLTEEYGGLLDAALARGLAGALELAIRELRAGSVMVHQTAAPPGSPAEQRLRSHVAYEGEHDEFVRWVILNAHRLQYDPMARKYVAAGAD